MRVSFDDIHGEGALATFAEKLDRLECIDVEVEEVDGAILELKYEGGSVRMHFDHAAGLVTFNRYVGGGEGNLSGLARAMPAALEAVGFERMRLQADRPQAEAAFRHIGFRGDEGKMHCTTERMNQYAEWRNGSASEPDWHAQLEN